MEANELDNKWLELNQTPTDGSHSTLRLAVDCVPDLYIGYNHDSNRCLILSLPKKNLVNILGEEKEYISISYFNESKHIIIKLKDETFNELFDHLIISLYQRIKTIVNPKESANQFISYYHKWSEFFNNSNLRVLSMNEIEGLFGELVVLKKILEGATGSTINFFLQSWVGPYDSGHDFILDHFDLEIKTKRHSKSNIKVSSEYQLEQDYGKGLYLTVISVDLNSQNSQNLRSLVQEIRQLVNQNLGDESIFLKALGQKSLTILNLKDYDNYRFEIKSIINYDCAILNFPKLTSKNIAPEISKVTYTLGLNSLQEFIAEDLNY